MTNILDKIVEQVKKRNQINQRFEAVLADYQALSAQEGQQGSEILLGKLNDRSIPINVVDLIRAREKNSNSPFLITECKHASPSKGVIRADYQPAEIAVEYVKGGSSAISVLVEEDFFSGGEDHFRSVRDVVDVPMLWKDFVVDYNQVLRAYQARADMVLLIVRILSDQEYRGLVKIIIDLGMTPLVEVFDVAEVERAVSLSDDLLDKLLLGVNNRDLTNFNVDLNQSVKVKDFLNNKSIDVPLISESGITSFKEVDMLMKNGFAGFLVGESLLRQDDVCSATRRLLGS